MIPNLKGLFPFNLLITSPSGIRAEEFWEESETQGWSNDPTALCGGKHARSPGPLTKPSLAYGCLLTVLASPASTTTSTTVVTMSKHRENRHTSQVTLGEHQGYRTSACSESHQTWGWTHLLGVKPAASAHYKRHLFLSGQCTSYPPGNCTQFQTPSAEGTTQAFFTKPEHFSSFNQYFF